MPWCTFRDRDKAGGETIRKWINMWSECDNYDSWLSCRSIQYLRVHVEVGELDLQLAILMRKWLINQKIYFNKDVLTYVCIIFYSVHTIHKVHFQTLCKPLSWQAVFLTRLFLHIIVLKEVKILWKTAKTVWNYKKSNKKRNSKMMTSGILNLN